MGIEGKMNEELCYLSTAFRYVNAFADWMSLGMIALSRLNTLKALFEMLF
jgi:hypothetical protein